MIYRIRPILNNDIKIKIKTDEISDSLMKAIDKFFEQKSIS